MPRWQLRRRTGEITRTANSPQLNLRAVHIDTNEGKVRRGGKISVLTLSHTSLDGDRVAPNFGVLVDTSQHCPTMVERASAWQKLSCWCEVMFVDVVRSEQVSSGSTNIFCMIPPPHTPLVPRSHPGPVPR